MEKKRIGVIGPGDHYEKLKSKIIELGLEDKFEVVILSDVKDLGIKANKVFIEEFKRRSEPFIIKNYHQMLEDIQIFKKPKKKQKKQYGKPSKFF